MSVITLVVRIQMRGDKAMRTLHNVRMTTVYPHNARPAPRGTSRHDDGACLVVHYMSMSKPSEYFGLEDIESLWILTDSDWRRVSGRE